MEFCLLIVGLEPVEKKFSAFIAGIMPVMRRHLVMIIVGRGGQHFLTEGRSGSMSV